MTREGWAIYLRKSRERMDTDDTLHRHRELCLEECKKNNFTIYGVYEEVVSGGSGIEKRPVFSEIVELLYNRILDGLMVIDLDRLSRVASEQEQVLGTLDYTDTQLYLVSEHRLVDIKNDKKRYKMLGFLADIELDIIKERYKRGRQGALSEGRYIGSKPPYGYMRIVRSLGSGKREKLLVPHPDEAPVVQKIFRWRLEGKGIHTIARALTERCIPTRTGKSFWSKGSIYTILGNPVYAGKIRTGQLTETLNTLDGKHNRTTKNLRVIDGVHQPLISEEDFDKVQAMSSHTWSSDRRGKSNPLVGLLYCKTCGYVVRRSAKTPTGNKKYTPRYEHSGAGELPDGTLCPHKGRGFRADFILELLALHLEENLKELQIVLTDEEVLSAQTQELEQKEKELKKLEKRKKDIIDTIADERTHSLVEDSIVHKAVIEELNARATKIILQINHVKEDIEELKNTMPKDTAPFQLTLTQAINALRDPTSDAQALNLLLKSFIKRIEIDFDKSLIENDSKYAKNRLPYLEVTYLDAPIDDEQEAKYTHKITKRTIRNTH